MLHLCTWVFVESRENASRYFQVPDPSWSEAARSAYWRCACVFFATSYRQHGSEVRHVLFVNQGEIPREVDGVDVAGLLERFEVEVVVLPLSFATPPGHYHAWRNQFFLFDIAHSLRRSLGGTDAAVVLDSDCVWISDAGSMHEALERDGVLTYVENYPPDWPANGMTREDMADVASELLGRRVQHPLVYCGGELFAATARELARIVPEIDVTWNLVMARQAEGASVFNEEAQTLSYIYYKLGYPLGNGDPYIRRIWTGSFGAFNTALPQDHGLTVWHVPMEKRLGLRRLFPIIANERSTFWSIGTARETRAYLGSHLGIPGNSMAKRARDVARRSYDKVRSIRR